MYRRNIVKNRDAIYKDVYNATIRVQLEVHMCAFVMQLGHAHIHILINNWSKEKKKKEQEKHHDLDMCISAFQYYYLRI